MYMHLLVFSVAGLAAAAQPGRDLFSGELIFPLEEWHNHGSCIVECPNGDLLVCWFHGSGERKSDDVLIRGARKLKGAEAWSEPFVMADTPGFPDTNCCMIIDPQKRLWLLWPTILANTWESALMKYRSRPINMQQEGRRVDMMYVLTRNRRRFPGRGRARRTNISRESSSPRNCAFLRRGTAQLEQAGR